MAVTPMTPQDIADAVNALGIDKATFTQFLAAAALLNRRNVILAQIDKANADANAGMTAAQGAITTLRTELAAVDAQYNALVGS